MRNLLVLGSGRCGTSLLAGLFRRTHYAGEALLPPSPSNPHGYFEDRRLNELNDRLLLARMGWLSRRRHRDPRALWLATPGRLAAPRVSPEDEERLRRYGARRPFCYKDPRFSFTLEAWRPHLPEDTGFVVVFRDPESTADSVLRHAVEYHPPLAPSRRRAHLAWRSHYERLWAAADGRWLFVRFSELLSGRALPALEAFAETPLDRSLLDPRGSRGERPSADPLYERLVARSRRDRRRWEGRP